MCNKNRRNNYTNIKDDTVIDIKNMNLTKQDRINLFSQFNQRSFSVITKFFKSTYLTSLNKKISGIVIFKVRAVNITLAIYKINLYLKKYAIDKDLKYSIIRIQN